MSTPALYVNGVVNLERENSSTVSQKNRRRTGNSNGNNSKNSGAKSPDTVMVNVNHGPQRGQKPHSAVAQKRSREQKSTREVNQRTSAQKQKQSPQSAAPRVKAVKQPRKNVRQNDKKTVKIVFLGGVGEIGKNMTAIECGDDIIIIDAGAIFPTEETPGFDLIVPDITYLIENRKKIRGLLLTHGHEDHIGGVPYLLKELKVPVIGTRLTLALVDNKLREHRINDAKEITVEPGQIIQLGCFKVRAVNVNHSIAGSLAFAVQTPQGVIFHSGDYKIDLTPVAGEPIDLKTISDFGASGVLLYMGESTNIERAGFTMSETVVGTTLDRLFGENLKRRLIVATFASNVHRLQQIIDLAVKYKRKVALSGRSMLNVVEAAEKIGEINIPDGAIVDVSKIKNMRDSEIVVVSTGSQGEPMSALSRMSNGDNQFVTVGDNDTVIISASPIPGNEKLVYRVINNLYKLGAEVVYESLQNIHVSGHACREEHKIMHHLLKPKFFIPVHGEYRHLKKHAQLAEELGMQSGRIIIPDIGNCVLLTAHGMKLGESVPSGSRLIDGEGIEDEKASTVIEDRRQLSEEGLFIVSITVSGGVVLGEPAINSRGFVFDFHRDYDREIRSVINRAIDGYDLSLGTVDELKRTIKRSLANYLYKKTKQSPMIVPVVVEL